MNNHRDDVVSSRANKRAQFADQTVSKPTARKKPAVVIIALLAIGGGAAAYFGLAGSDNRPTVVATSDAGSVGSSDDLTVSVNEVSGGAAKFFDYKLANSQQVRFFVVKSSVGDYRVALDACEMCSRAKKGYHQDGDDMVCNNCGKRFPTAMIGKLSGGCHPIGLKASNDGTHLVIKKSDLEAGAKYF